MTCLVLRRTDNVPSAVAASEVSTVRKNLKIQSALRPNFAE